jgi:hypothetical protein
MDDDRNLDDLAGQPLDAIDASTLRELRAAYDVADPVPTDLVERLHFALALDEVFDEVARITRLPQDTLAVRGEHGAATRTETLTFSAERLTAMVTVTRVAPGRLRLDGWLAPPEACLVRLRVQDGPTHELRADEQGRFSFDGLAEGFGQLSFHPSGSAQDQGEATNAVVTPLFQL